MNTTHSLILMTWQRLLPMQQTVLMLSTSRLTIPLPANTEIINNICQPAGVPIIAGEEGICSGCGVATLSISYYDLGVATGKMAAKILTGESNISEMPIEYAPQFTKKYNKTICEALGVTVPDDYVAIRGVIEI